MSDDKEQKPQAELSQEELEKVAGGFVNEEYKLISQQQQMQSQMMNEQIKNIGS